MEVDVKILLFKKENSIISKAISHITNSDITHGAIFYKDCVWDASEKRGNFAQAKIKDLLKRTVLVYSLSAEGDQVNSWLLSLVGRKYDYIGILGWFLFWHYGRFFEDKVNSKCRVYCFEAVAELITLVKNSRFPKHISGKDIKSSLGKPEYLGQFEDYINENK